MATNISHMLPPSVKNAAHSGFETQRRHHQKSETGVSVAPKMDMCPTKNFKKKHGRQRRSYRFHVPIPLIQPLDPLLHFGGIFLPAATKLGQGNIFTSVCQEFCPRGGGVLPQCMLGYTPGADTHPPTHPRTRRPPPREADCSIRSTSGRYASYWNAFLFTDMSISISIWGHFYTSVANLPAANLPVASLPTCLFFTVLGGYGGMTC